MGKRKKKAWPLTDGKLQVLVLLELIVLGFELGGSLEVCFVHRLKLGPLLRARQYQHNC